MKLRPFIGQETMKRDTLHHDGYNWERKCQKNNVDDSSRKEKKPKKFNNGRKRLNCESEGCGHDFYI